MWIDTPPSLALREVINARRGELEALLANYRAKNPKSFGSVAGGDAHEGSDIDILVEMDPAEGNLLMRASGLMEEARQLYARDDIDIFRRSYSSIRSPRRRLPKRPTCERSALISRAQ